MAAAPAGALSLIESVNKLQETFASIGGDQVDLPQCVVVGAQSSGKSSVLETLVGKDFLPRGGGIVTRRPLVLQLIHTPLPAPHTNDSDDSDSPPESLNDTSRLSPPQCAEWGEFLHLDSRFTDFDEIRREIERETFRVAGQNKGVSKLPIHLKIHSPNVLNLTLVDLPGLTKIPVGDQPSDIERQIRSLVWDYISKPNCIILAISPANVDLANSDSLKLARSVDPQGHRTIGVLTKLDLMESGTNALDILTGTMYPLKLGFIGVVNRSQQDINGKMSMLEARQAEEDFFRSHPAYRSIAHRSGTKYLARVLNTVLMNHIREKLPDMKARLNTLMGQAQQELVALGDAGSVDENEQAGLVLRLMTQFARDFVSSIDGTSLEISTKELSGGARIYYIFNDVFGNALQGINPTSNLTEQEIRTAIRNSTGPRPSLFVPEQAFELLIKPQIKLLEFPSLRCVELVYEELMKICHNLTNTELERFPRLHAQLIEVISDLLRERLGPTSEYVQSLIAIQAAYINTNHPAFVRDSAAISEQTRQMHNQQAQNHTRQRRPHHESNLESPELSVEADEENLHSPSTAPPRAVARRRNKAGPETGHEVQMASSSQASGPAGNEDRSHAGQRQGEGFLTYFFGATAGPGAAIGGGGASSARPLPGGDVNRSSHLPAQNASSHTEWEGANAAYDMKSLEKHLEPLASERANGESYVTPREEMEISLIRSLINSYFNVVRQMIEDLVPKAIMHLLVNLTRDTVQNRLVKSLYRDSLWGELLQEDEAVRVERKRIHSLLTVYQEAFKILSDVTLKPTP